MNIPFGIPAANKQNPILMEYPVTLPDDMFVLRTKHKLISSIYATSKIKEEGLTYYYYCFYCYYYCYYYY